MEQTELFAPNQVLTASSPNQQLVVQSNRLIDARRNLSLGASRLFALAIANLRPADSEKHTMVSFDADTMANLIGGYGQRGGKLYNMIRDAAAELRHTEIKIPSFDRGDRPGDFLDVQLCSSAQMKGGVLELEFSLKLLPYLTNLRDRFTQYGLAHALKLKSRHAFRLYELIKSWDGWRDKAGHPKPWRMSVLQLREFLGIASDEYESWKDFRRRVLDVGIDQVNEKTDVRIKAREIRQGKKVVEIEFLIEAHPTDVTKDAKFTGPLAHFTPGSRERLADRIREICDELGLSRAQELEVPGQLGNCVGFGAAYEKFLSALEEKRGWALKNSPKNLARGFISALKKDMRLPKRLAKELGVTAPSSAEADAASQARRADAILETGRMRWLGMDEVARRAILPMLKKASPGRVSVEDVDVKMMHSFVLGSLDEDALAEILSGA